MDKVYADKQGKAVFQCPECGFKTAFDASSYREKDSRIKIKCRCGVSVPVLIEFRAYYRRPVALSGWCHVHRTEELLEIRVNDLSMSGLSFTVEGGTGESPAALEVGDALTVQFRLDRPPHDLIQRRGEVRNIRETAVGVRFSKSEYDKELGFYLLR
ncbi:PilZ domain-containing protein [Desulfomicrobium salsuginis]